MYDNKNRIRYSDGRRPKVVKWGQSLSEDLSDVIFNQMRWHGTHSEKSCMTRTGVEKIWNLELFKQLEKLNQDLRRCSADIESISINEPPHQIRAHCTKLTQAIKNKSTLSRISSEDMARIFNSDEFVNASLDKMKNDQILNTLIPEITEIPPLLIRFSLSFQLSNCCSGKIHQ